MKPLTPDAIILGLLAIQARHGYELLDCFRRPSQLGRVWNLSTSQIYAVLKRLETQQWITGSEVQQDSAPPRTEFALTPEGEANLMKWLDEENPSPSIRHIRVEFLSRLYVARQLGIPLEPIIERQRQVCQQQHTKLLADQEHVAPGLERLALDLHIAQVEVVLQWIDRCQSV